MREIYFKFYPRNWRAAVQGLTPIAKAVWFDMTLAMREAQPVGYFVGSSGEPIDIAYFARFNGYKPAEVRRAIMELKHRGVCSTDDYGRIFCRFIVNEAAKSEQGRLNGLMGGNPALISDRVNPQDNPTDKPSVNQKDNRSLKPARSRSQITDQRSSSDSLRSSATAYGSWPAEVGLLRGIALLFIAAFANCLDPIKAEKHMPEYLAVLAQMRSRGVTIAEAWRACDDALEANGKPLFGASIKKAMSYLPARSTRQNGATPSPQTSEFAEELRARERC